MGRNIISPNDPLSKISLEDLYRMITQPPGDLASMIQQLRTIQSLDMKKYQGLKKMLPYVTCGLFQPPYRRSENFASVRCFILDIDHLSSKDIAIESLREKLKADDRISLLFVSPGNDGLKALFTLKEKCYDRGRYSLFYKLFLARFAAEYGLEQSVDKVTSDVTRACFLSVDEDAWYNPFAPDIDMQAYVDFDNYSSLEQANHEIREAADKAKEAAIEVEAPDKQALPPDVLQAIREKLNPNVRLKKEKQIFVPQELNNVLEQVKQAITAHGIEVKSIDNIHYGKKFVFTLGNRWAQFNLFYGRQGFRIVKTPAGGSDAALADITYRILCELFY